jgi:hypothetical protein
VLLKENLDDVDASAVNSYLNSLGKSGLADFLERTSEKIKASDSRQTIAIKAKLIEYSSLPLMTEILGGLFPEGCSFVSCSWALPVFHRLGNIERVGCVNKRGR